MNIYPTKLIFFAWLGWLCTPTCLHAQSTSVLTLTQERYDVPLKSFYIDSVRDARKETTLVGHKNGKTPIVLQNSAATALKLFADSNITQDHGQTPVTVAISKLDIEARDEQGTWVTDGSVAFSFYAGGMPLVEFSDSGHQEAGQYAPDYIDLFIRQSFEGSLKQFDEWWPEQKSKVATSDIVKVNVTMATRPDKPGIIVFTTDRPLKIADFNGPYPDINDSEMAATASGIGMQMSGSVSESQLVVDVMLTPFFTCNESWFKPEGKNELVLAHEQTHFDITALNTCELKKAILSTTFTKSNYQQRLQELYDQYSKLLRVQETQYDEQTHHGIITTAQQAWQQKIRSAIVASGCY